MLPWAAANYPSVALSTRSSVLLYRFLLRSPNFELRTQCQAVQVNRDSSGKKATGVTYYDAAGREVFQPASLVVLGFNELHWFYARLPQSSPVPQEIFQMVQCDTRLS